MYTKFQFLNFIFQPYTQLHARDDESVCLSESLSNQFKTIYSRILPAHYHDALPSHIIWYRAVPRRAALHRTAAMLYSIYYKTHTVLPPSKPTPPNGD